MHTNLYLSLEFQKPNKDWSFFIQFPDTGYMHVLQTLLGNETGDEIIPKGNCLTPKGFPPDVDVKSIEEDSYIIDNNAANSDIGEIINTVRFCSREDANEWVEKDKSFLIKRGYGVTDPEAFGHSWVSSSELKNLLHLCEKYKEQGDYIVRAIIAVMESLENDGFNARVVYWFS